MFCKNCGKQIPNESARFCPYCGTNVDLNTEAAGMPPTTEQAPYLPPEAPYTPPQAPYTSQQASYVFPQTPPYLPPQTPPARSKKKLIIAISAVSVAVALILALVGYSIAMLGGFEHWRMKLFASPQEYYRYIEKREAESAIRLSLVSYDLYKSRPLNDMSTETKIKLNLGEDAINLARYSMDISWLAETTINFNTNSKGDLTAYDANILVGNESLLSLKAVLDMLVGEAYLQIPELSSTYLSAYLGNVYSVGALREMTDAQENLPEARELELLAQKYVDIALSQINNVTKASDTLQAGEVTQKCTTLTVTIDGRTAQALAEAILTEMLNDRELENALIAFIDFAGAGSSLNYSYSDFDYQELVGQALEKVRNETDFSEGEIVMTLWLDNRGKLQGRRIVSTSDNGEAEFYYYMPQSGNNFGFRAGFDTPEHSLSFSGNGSYAGLMLSGAFKLRYDGEDWLNIDIGDYDTDEAQKGFLNASITIVPAAGLRNRMYQDTALPDLAATLISGYSLRFDFSAYLDHSQVKFSIIDARERVFATMELSNSQGGGGDIAIPSGDVITVMGIDGEFDTAALLEWAATIDGDAFVNDLKNRFDIPPEVMQQIENLFAMLSMLQMLY
jgi:hypothetical protein